MQSFGPRDYVLKSVSPRFAVLWKHKQDSATPEENDERLRVQLERVERKTRLHTYGIVGLGIATAVGFGLSHIRFSDTEARIARLEAIARTLPAGNLHCPNCGGRLIHMLQQQCDICKVQLTWPDKLPLP